jgi:serine protease Do
MDKFVCVRIVQANALDLTQFQFDFDQTFAVFFLNADKTIYGRYGTRSNHDDSTQDISLEGLRKAMEGALSLHRDFSRVKPALAAKKLPLMKQKQPEEFAALAKYKPEINYQEKTAQSCMHCHQVRDAEIREFRAKREAVPDEVLFAYPKPDVLGLKLNVQEAATVEVVAAGSAASQAGFQAGDKIASLAGQPILSIADVQWVLHTAKVPTAEKPTRIPAQVHRGEKTESLSLILQPGWRKTANLSWRTSAWDLRRMGFGGMFLGELSAEERAKAGLKEGDLGLLAKHVGEYGEHAVALRAGVRKGDILISFDGIEQATSESALLAHAVQVRQPGETVAIKVLRGGKVLEFKIALQ